VDVAGSYTPTVDHGTDEKATGTITFADGTIISLEADTVGDLYNANIVFTEDGGVGDTPGITWNAGTSEQNIKINTGGNSAAELVAAINTDGDSKFTAVLVHDGGTGFNPTADNGAGVVGVKATTSFSFLAGASTLVVEGAVAGTTAETYSVVFNNAGNNGAASAAWDGVDTDKLVVQSMTIRR